MENDHMIEALPPNGTNDALDVRSPPRGARRGQYFADAHIAHLFPEFRAEDDPQGQKALEERYMQNTDEE